LKNYEVIKNQPVPPKIPLKILRWYCNDDRLEEIEGDAYEIFYKLINTKGYQHAKIYYWWIVLRCFKPYAYKNSRSKKNKIYRIMYFSIFQNYIKISLRNIGRQKMFSVINMLSLTIGLSCSILIYLFIHDELSFDHMHKKYDRIFRINKVSYNKQGSPAELSPAHPMPFRDRLIQDIPEFENTARIYNGSGYVILNSDFFKQDFGFADPEIFKIFSFNFINGNPENALNQKYNAVISEDYAIKYFGKTDVIDEVLTINYNGNNHEVTVSGVVENIPYNTTFRFELLMPFQFFADEGWGADYRDYWRLAFIVVYTWMPEEVSVDQLDKKLPEIRESHYQQAGDPYENSEYTLSYQLQPLSDVHFNTTNGGALTASVDPQNNLILSALGFSILLIGCFNFVLLTMGDSTRRVKEIALRKVIGAPKNQIIIQLMVQAMVMSFIGLALALLLSYLLLPIFNDLAQKHLEFTTVFQWINILGLLGITLVTGLLSGGYPAAVISGAKITESLQNKFKLGGSNYMTKMLLTLQFTICLGLIIGTMGMLYQMDYLYSKDMGFNKEQLMVIQRNDVESDKFYNLFKDRLNNNPNIINISGSNPAFTHGGLRSEFEYEGEDIPYEIFFVDTNYINTMEMNLVAGRDFIPGSASDSTESIIVNQAFVRAIGMADPIGKPVNGLNNAGYTNPIIIGVIEDFSFR